MLVYIVTVPYEPSRVYASEASALAYFEEQAQEALAVHNDGAPAGWDRLSITEKVSFLNGLYLRFRLDAATVQP